MWEGGATSNISKRILLLIFGCLLLAVISFIFIQEGYQKPSPASPTGLMPTGKVRNHINDSDDTKDGKCLKYYFEDILLIIVYHFPLYESIPLIKSFYKDAFKNILICGPETYLHSHVMVVDVGRGLYGYQCAGEAIRQYPGYQGYLYVNDDMIVNWWTFSYLDKERFWQGARVLPDRGHIMGHRPIPNNWPWWKTKSHAAKACEASYLEITQNYRSNDIINITKLVKTHLVNGEGEKICFRMWSDLFYVPKKFSDSFQRLSFVFHKNRVFLEVAVPTIMSFLDLRDSWEKHFGMYLPNKYGSINFADGKIVWKEYKYDINFIHPVKFHGDKAKRNRKKLRNYVIPYSKQFTKC